MENVPKVAARSPVKKAQVPIWALRLAAAFTFAGITDKKGNVDKKRAGALLNVGPKTIESWITGRTQPQFEKLIQVRTITKVSLDWILSDVMWPVLAESQPRLEEGPRTIEMITTEKK
jgi:hypothetical protein